MNVLPTLVELYNGVITSMQSQFGTTIPDSLKALLRGIAGSWSGQLKKLYLAQGNVQKNIWYDTADPEAIGGTLERFGRAFLGRDPYAATQGEYTVSIAGTTGSVIKAQTTWLSDASSISPNYLFVLDNDYTLSGTGDIITLRATTAGTVALLNTGNTLTATKPLSQVNQSATVAAVTTSPVDAETTEEYRSEIGLQVRLAPQGGAVADYILWGRAFAGVANIYAYTANGSPWQVNVYVEAIPADSVGPPFYGVPTTTILNGVTSYINNDPVTGIARKPMGVLIGAGNAGAMPVTVFQVAIQFAGTSNLTAQNKMDITNALIAAVNNIRPYIPGATAVAAQNDTISVSLPANNGNPTPPEDYVIIVIAMTAVPGAIFTGVQLSVNGATTGSYTFDNGIIPFLDPTNVTFI